MNDTRDPDAPESVPENLEAALEPTGVISPAFIARFVGAVGDGDKPTLWRTVKELHPADTADLLEHLPPEAFRKAIHLLGKDLPAEAVAELSDNMRLEALHELTDAAVTAMIGHLDSDDASFLLSDLEEDRRARILTKVSATDRAAIESSLSFDEESAGRLMQRDLIAVPEHMTVGQVIDYLRDNQDLTTDFWEVFIVDPQHKPIGTANLSWILRTPRNVGMSDVMKREQTLIPVDMDQEEVALRFQKYALISAAVVDPAGRLVGMITVDDVVHIIQEEASEDILKLSGAGDGDINEPILDSYKSRVRWLIANLITALVASSIIRLFEGTIAQMVALATLMPIVAGVGGNAGTQTMAVAVRAIATNQLTHSNTLRTIAREIRVAFLNGATVALVIGLGVALVFTNAQLGMVIAAAMMTNIVFAGFAGVMVPVILDRMDVDPAVSSSVFVTMITDSMGFFAFLGLASLAGLAS